MSESADLAATQRRHSDQVYGDSAGACVAGREVSIC